MIRETKIVHGVDDLGRPMDLNDRTLDATAAVAYWNGQIVPTASLALPIFDAGFIQGLTVAEQLRTFGGKLFRLEDHLRRLQHSLEIVGVDPGVSMSDLAEVVQDLAQRNHRLLDPDDDLAVAIWVTPGPYAKYASLAPPGPNVCCHMHPLDFYSWSDRYEAGERLVTSQYRQVSPQNWPPELKCRSRMHYYLADKEAREKEPGARALLLDLDGFVCEASTANVLCFLQDEGIVAPRQEKTLPGISISVLRELAESLQISFTHRDLTPAEFAQADEILLCSTSPCVLSVVRLDGQPIGDGRPGPTYRRLLSAWSNLVELNIMEQAQRFSSREMLF